MQITPETINAIERARALRAWAARIEREARGPRPPAESVAAAAQFINQHPGALGKEVAAAIGVSHEHFRGWILQRLIAMGYHNPGRGYYPPQ